MQSILTFLEKIKAFLVDFFAKPYRKGATAAVVIVVLLLLFFIAKPKTTKSVTSLVERRALASTVLATGQLTSATDLDLSFKTSDVVTSIPVSVGDVVRKGAVLAMLNNQDELGALNQARGALALAEANKKKIIEGATTQEVRVAEVALDAAQKELENTKDQQEVLVKNARRALLSNGLEAVSSSGVTTGAPTISGTYTGDVEGSYILSVYGTQSGGYFTLSGIESATGTVSTTQAERLGSKGLFVQFPAGVLNSGTVWTIALPNTRSASYATYYNAYQLALSTSRSAIAAAESVVRARQAELDLRRKEARPSEIEAADAEILSAQGRLQSAQAAYENTIIRAPADGTITKIDVKIGETVSPGKTVIVLEDVKNLYLEANINEANIAEISLEQTVSVTFDAFGPDKLFTATVSHIDPSSTIVSGVVNYKIKAAMVPDTTIRPGMTANMTVVTNQKQDVLVVPLRAVVKKDGKTFVRLVTDKKTKAFTETSVVTGLEGDDGVEVVSGLSEGDEVIVLLDEKK